MARVIGYVKSLQNGVFSAKDAQGAIRELKAGDQVFQNELVYGSQNNPQNAQIIIDVAFADAKDITLFGSAQLYTDLSAIGGAFEKDEAIVSKDAVESAWKLSTGTPNLEGQVDSPAAGFEETAAGAGLSDSERAGGPVFDARTGATGDVTTTTQSTVNGEIKPNLAGPDTQNLNDRPVVEDVAVTVNEARGPSENGELTEFSGQLVASDPDVGDTHTFFAVEGTFLINGEPAPEGVTFVLNEDGTYSVIGDFNALAIGENAIITFQYYAVDNGVDVGAPHDSLPATVTITVQGTNDQPVVSDINVNGDGEQTIGMDTLSVTNAHWSPFGESNTAYYAQSFVATETDLSNVQFALANPSGPDNVEFRVLITELIEDWSGVRPGAILFESGNLSLASNSSGDVRFSVDIDLASDLVIGHKYAVIYDSYVLFDGQHGTATLASQSGNPDPIGQFFYLNVNGGDRASHFANVDWSETSSFGYDGGLILTYGSGEKVIYETRDSGESSPLINDGNNILTGILSVEDDDARDTHTFNVVPNTLEIGESEAGINTQDVKVSIYAVDANGNKILDGDTQTPIKEWKYEIDGDFTKLAAGETVTVKFQYVANDGHNIESTDLVNEKSESAPAWITLKITGTNDQPVISDININTPLSFGSENWFAEGNGLTITGYENNGSVVTPVLHEGGLGIGSGWGEDSQINDQVGLFSGRTAEAIVFGFEKAFNTATIELTSLNEGTWYSNDEKAEWIAYKDGVEVGRGILTAQDGADIFTIHTTSDFNSLKIAPPLDWETDSFYVKSLDVSKTFYESDTPVMSTFTGNLDAIVTDDDASDERTFALYGSPSAGPAPVTDLNVVISDGTYSVTGNFNALAAGETATVTFQYVADDKRGFDGTDGINESSISAPKTVTLTITGTNDAPILASVDSTGGVQEDTSVSAGVLRDTGVIAFTDVDLSDIHTVSVAPNRGALGTLTAVISENNDGDGVGSVTWTYSVNNARVQYLGADETREETFTITVRDNNGVTDTQAVKVTITGTNDVPVLASENSHGSVKEDANVSAGVLKDTGVIAFTDVDLSDAHTVSVAPNADALGTLTAVISQNNDGDGDGRVRWTYSVDNTKVQYLGVDDTRVETFTINIDDGHGGTDTQEVRVTIKGTNDAPIIASVDSTGSIQEDTGVVEGFLKDTGVIAFTDVDLSDTHMVSVAPNRGALGTLTAVISENNDGDGAGNVTWTYSVDNASVQYLGADETRVETFTITVRDNHGATDTQEVKVTITGTNDTPVITNLASALVGAVTEDAPATTVFGQLTATDADTSATKTWSIFGVPSTTYGAISIDATTGKWTYTLDNSLSATQALGVNDHVTQIYTARVTDDKGAFVDQTITVTINGAYDAPVVTAHAYADHIITNAGTSPFVVPEWALLANDIGATDVTAISNRSDLTTVNLTSNSGSVTIQDDNDAPGWAWWDETNGGSFDYTANGSTAHVDVTQDSGRNLDGTDGNDILISNNGQPDIHAGKGNDILIGSNGNDYLYGEAGNDTLVYNPNNGIIDGGTGTDTLVFTQQNPNIDFSYWYSNNEPISGIEVLDLSKANVNLVNISYRDVLDITDNSGKLTILGDVSDNVDFSNDGGWSKAATPVTEAVNGVNHTFEVYTNSHDSTVLVKVEQNIHDTI